MQKRKEKKYEESERDVWHDEECRVKRKEVIEAIRKTKRGEVGRVECKKLRKEYKRLINRKKEEQKRNRRRQVNEKVLRGNKDKKEEGMGFRKD